jgi:hypothetical protein
LLFSSLKEALIRLKNIATEPCSDRIYSLLPHGIDCKASFVEDIR